MKDKELMLVKAVSNMKSLHEYKGLLGHHPERDTPDCSGSQLSPVGKVLCLGKDFKTL